MSSLPFRTVTSKQQSPMMKKWSLPFFSVDQTNVSGGSKLEGLLAGGVADAEGGIIFLR